MKSSGYEIELDAIISLGKNLTSFFPLWILALNFQIYVFYVEFPLKSGNY